MDIRRETVTLPGRPREDAFNSSHAARRAVAGCYGWLYCEGVEAATPGAQGQILLSIEEMRAVGGGSLGCTSVRFFVAMTTS